VHGRPVTLPDSLQGAGLTADELARRIQAGRFRPASPIVSLCVSGALKARGPHVSPSAGADLDRPWRVRSGSFLPPCKRSDPYELLGADVNSCLTESTSV